MRNLGTVLALIIGLAPLRADEFVWNNAAGGNWNLSSNWNPAMVPGAADNATLGSLAGAYAVALTDDRSITNLSITAADATLNQSAGTLTVSGAFTLSAGTYNLSGGTINANGSFS